MAAYGLRAGVVGKYLGKVPGDFLRLVLCGGECAIDFLSCGLINTRVPEKTDYCGIPYDKSGRIGKSLGKIVQYSCCLPCGILGARVGAVNAVHDCVTGEKTKFSCEEAKLLIVHEPSFTCC
jgi:hypothetical protein